MDVRPHLNMPVKRHGTPAQHSADQNEDALFALTDEIAEREDIPHEVAYRYALQRFATVKEAPVCNSQ